MKMKDRVAKARFIAQSGFCKTLSRDKLGRATVVEVPGSNAKRYRVIIRRMNGAISTECQLETGGGYIDCKGNHAGVCYHSFAAIIHSANEQGQSPSFSKSKENAHLITNIDGKVIVRVISKQNSNVFTNSAYITLKPGKPSAAPLLEAS